MKALFRHAQKRANALGRISVAIAVLLAPLATATAAHAALTSPTWTVMDPRTNIAGNRYDYGFTTAQTSAQRITATVPAGTSGSNRYLSLDGFGKNYASTPDSTFNSFTGNLEITAKISSHNWANSLQTIAAKRNSAYAFQFRVINTGLEFQVNNGTTGFSVTTPANSITTPNDGNLWVRGSFNASTSTTNIYMSSDGINWTLSATNTYSAVSSIQDTTDALEIGSISGGTAQNFNGRIYFVSLSNAIAPLTNKAVPNCAVNGVQNCFDPSSDAVGGTSWTAQSLNAETWTVNRFAGTLLQQADVASDLSVMNVSGIDAGGYAQLREIEGVVAYSRPNFVGMTITGPVKLGFAGMTNTYTAGAYTSSVKLYDGNATVSDSGTTGSVTISAPNINAYGSTPLLITAPTPATSVDMLPLALDVRGTTLTWGDYYASTVNKIDLSTNMASRVAGSGSDIPTNNTPLLSSFTALAGAATDGSGNTFISDNGGGQIRKITASAVTTVAGTGADASPTYSGVATGASLSNVNGMVADSAGNVYFADTNRNIIRKFATDGTLSTIAGNGTAGSTINSTALTSNLNGPFDVALDSTAANLFIADTNNNRVLKVVIATGAISVVAGGGASFADGGSATATTLSSPQGVAVATNGDLYISAYSENRIRKVSGGIITTVAGTGTAGFSGDGGAATSAQINVPRQLRLDASGNLYFVDWKNQRIRELSGTTISTYAGTGVSTYKGDGGNVANARFYKPTAIHADTNGNVFIADAGNNAIRKIDQFGNVSTVAGTGGYFTASDYGDGGLATAAGVYKPRDVMPDGSGNLYFSDNNAQTIRKVDSSGIISSFTTTVKAYDIAFSPDFSILYAASDCTVTKIIVATKAISTIAGTGTCTATSTGDYGSATAATFKYTRGLAVDAAGNVYVSDWANNVIRVIDLDGRIRTIAGAASGTSNTTGVRNVNRAVGNVDFMTMDTNGDLYTGTPYQVVKVGANGISNNVAGNATMGYTGDGGAATSAQISGVTSVALSLGNAYILDGSTYTLRVVAQQASVKPLVNADSMSVAMNKLTTWPILSNDWSRSNEMDPSSVVITSAPAHGAVTISNPTTEGSTLQANYTPTTNYTGSDSFIYQACDTTRVLCGTATVSITVGGNAVTTLVGGAAEGYATEIGFTPVRMARLRNYIFYDDSTYNIIRRYDIYTGQTVVIAGNYTVGNSGSGGPATAASMNAPLGIAVDPSGNLYFADNGNNLVRRIAGDGTITSLASPGGGTLGVTFTQAGLPTVALGLTVKTYNGTSWTTIAGTGSTGTSGDGGLATAAQFTTINGLTTAPNGDIYVSDNTACTVRRISSGYIYAVAGIAGTCSLSGDAGAATAATLNGPRGLSFDNSGNLLIADALNNRIRRVTTAGIISSPYNGISTPTDVVSGTSTTDYFTVNNGASTGSYVTNGGVPSTVMGIYAIPYFGGDNVVGGAAQLWANWPDSLGVDNSNRVYFGSLSPRIQRYDPATNLVTSVVGDNNNGYGANRINGNPGQLTFDSSNRPVFTDPSNSIVRRIDGVGVMTNIAGTPQVSGSTGDGGQATAATVAAWGLTYGPDGSMYVSGGGFIRRVATNGIITTIAGTGAATNTGDGGPATAATLNDISTLVVDSAGNVYAGEKGGCQIRMIDTKGIISTIAGGVSCTTTASAARAAGTGINPVNGLTVDAVGNVYFSEGGGAVKKVDAATNALSTVVGAFATGFVDNTTSATAASFNTIRAIYMQQSTGNLYIADAKNGRIRMATGIGTVATNATTSASWTVVPAATGHTNLREVVTVTPATTSVASKLAITVPTSFAATSTTAIETYGLTGAVNTSVSGTTLTLSFTSQTLTAGVPIGISFESVTNGGANGVWNASVATYDSAGTMIIGWATTNAVNITSSGGPVQGAAGFASLWKRSLSTTQSAFPTVAVSPAGTTDTTSAVTLTNSGSINANTATLSATAMVTPSAVAMTAVSASPAAPVASASFVTNRWGLQFVTASGTNSTSGSGYFSGLTSAAIATGAGATNVLTVTPRAKVDYLQPAGTYKSTLTWRFSAGV